MRRQVENGHVQCSCQKCTNIFSNVIVCTKTRRKLSEVLYKRQEYMDNGHVDVAYEVRKYISTVKMHSDRASITTRR